MKSTSQQVFGEWYRMASIELVGRDITSRGWGGRNSVLPPMAQISVKSVRNQAVIVEAQSYMYGEVDISPQRRNF